MEKIVVNNQEITGVRGVSIERLYKVYQSAIEDIPTYWAENCFVDCDTDYKPLEAFLCISRDEDDCWYYRDLPYSWQNGWSEMMYYATKIDLLENEVTAVTDYFEGSPYDENGHPYDWATKEDLEAWDKWEEETKAEYAKDLDFRPFEDIVEELIEG